LGHPHRRPEPALPPAAGEQGARPRRPLGSIDAKALYAATVALSEVYDCLIADAVRRDVGASWSLPGVRIDGVDDALLAEFSTAAPKLRSHYLLAEFRTTKGRAERRIAFSKVGLHIRFNAADVEDFIRAGRGELWPGQRSRHCLGATNGCMSCDRHSEKFRMRGPNRPGPANASPCA
jgi:hypothetical protein